MASTAEFGDPHRAVPAEASALPTMLEDAVARAVARLTGLIVVAGPDADAVADGFVRWHIRAVDPIADRSAALSAIEAAEHGLVVAQTTGGDAVTAILELRRLATDRFALAAALRLVIAQRPVAALCGGCREPVQAFGSSAALLGLDPGTMLWSATGCEACDGSGRRGGTRVFEAVEVDAAMRRLIYDGADAPLLARHAFLTAPNLSAAARAMAREGLIAPEDAVRVSRG